MRVLLIDDEVGLLRGLRRVLASEGHEVEILESGEAGLERCLQDPVPDAVFCDLMLPDLLGSVVHARAIARRPELDERFVFMTGGVLDVGAQRFVDEHRDRILWKPFTVRAMAERLRRLAPRPVRASSGRLPAARRPPAG